MRHSYVFSDSPEYPELEKWNYQAIELPSLGKVQLWYQVPGQPWELGHSKEIPPGYSFEQVAELMHGYMTGAIHHDEYNTILPR